MNTLHVSMQSLKQCCIINTIRRQAGLQAVMQSNNMYTDRQTDKKTNRQMIGLQQKKKNKVQCFTQFIFRSESMFLQMPLFACHQANIVRKLVAEDSPV